MKRVVLFWLCMLLVASASFAIPIAVFEDTASFAERAKDIIVAKCDRVSSDVHFGDDLHPVDVTVVAVLKGKTPIAAMKLATIYPMRAGKTYLLTSLGGAVADINFLAVPELSVVELPEEFDVSDLKDQTLEEQLNAIFSARMSQLDRQQKMSKEEADLLTKALEKVSGAEAPAPRYDLRTLQAELGRVLHRHFPGATSHRLDNRIYFERDTRTFLVHHALKTGEWQDPVEERGPKLNGIIIEVAIAAGPYRGAAIAPQSFDRHYFTSFFMAPHSEKLDAHLHVIIKHTPQVPPAFLKELTAVLDRFDEHVRKPEK